ncbi:TonB-dependent receptor, partial [Desulfovibrio sp.]|uniref:TonB-dependent receptor n=1 Tax=Desulfovibrio sp. TaxID=885 RepID=UPI0025BB1DA6
MYADKYEGAFESYGPPDGSLSLETQSNRRGHNDGYLLAPTLTWEKDFGPVTLTSITNYSRSNYNYLQDWDFTSVDAMYSTYDEDFNTLSQELRLNGGPDSFRWMVGLFGLTERIDTKTDIIFGDDAGMMWMNPGDHAQQNSTIYSNIASAFAQIIWRALPMIEITGAARFDYERKSLDWENKTNIMGVPTGSLNMSKDWTAVSPSLSIAWLFTERQRVYASIARGFKSGDFNNVMVEKSLVEHAVDPEYTTTYELGYKGKLLDNRLELSAALFYVDWDNMQVDIESPSGMFSNYQKMNAGRAHSSGFEVEARALLMPGWEVFASVGYMFDYKFDEFKQDANKDLSGQNLPYTNAYTLGAGSVFRMDSGFFMSVDGSLNGRKYLLEDNSLRQPAYALVNAKIGYEKDNWDVFLYGRNLLDQRYATTAFGRSKRAGEPLMVGVQCGLSF